MFEVKRYWHAFWDFVMIAAIWVSCIAFLGVVARAMKEIFCLGYGC